MEREPTYTATQALRVLARATGSRAEVSSAITMEEIAAAAECLGVSRASVIRAASLEGANSIGSQLLLGSRTSFEYRALLDRPVAAEHLAGTISAAGRQGGQVHALPGSLEWHHQGPNDWVRVMIGDEPLAIAIVAQRSTALGFLPWFGPGAGVLLLGGWHSLSATGGTSPSPAMVLVVALFGFAVARAAWTRIVEQWQEEMARFAATVESCLRDSAAGTVGRPV